MVSHSSFSSFSLFSPFLKVQGALGDFDLAAALHQGTSSTTPADNVGCGGKEEDERRQARRDAMHMACVCLQALGAFGGADGAIARYRRILREVEGIVVDSTREEDQPQSLPFSQSSPPGAFTSSTSSTSSSASPSPAFTASSTSSASSWYQYQYALYQGTYVLENRPHTPQVRFRVNMIMYVISTNYSYVLEYVNNRGVFIL